MRRGLIALFGGLLLGPGFLACANPPGRQVYLDSGCARCHGSDLSGSALGPPLRGLGALLDGRRSGPVSGKSECVQGADPEAAGDCSAVPDADATVRDGRADPEAAGGIPAGSVRVSPGEAESGHCNHFQRSTAATGACHLVVNTGQTGVAGAARILVGAARRIPEGA